MQKKQKLDSAFFSLLRNGVRRVKSFFLHAGDGTLAALWFAAVSIVLLLLFLLSAGFRSEITRKKINEYLLENRLGRVLISPVSAWRGNGEAMNSGLWWKIGRESEVDKTESYGVVLPVLRDGVFAPFLGIILESGDVELIPLTKSAKTIQSRLTAGMLDVYKRRVSIAAKKIISGKL